MGGSTLTVPRLLATNGHDRLALIYALQLGSTDDDRFVVETVDSIDPRYPRDEKTVIILSTQFGCPVGCPMCDAGGSFVGNLTPEQMLDQVRFVVGRRPKILGSRKLKVHFARMGEPAYNSQAVIQALEALPDVLPAPGLMPCIATVAPAGSDAFLDDLSRVKRRLYPGGRFQLQMSINSTDPAVRARLIPVPHLDLETLARAGRRFHEAGDRKVALNFALASGVPLDPEVLRRHFDPDCFMVKLTPVNPTERARGHGLDTVLSASEPEAARALVARLHDQGFDVVVSIGEEEEIAIGSNCGQLVRARPWRQEAPAA